MTDVKDIKLKKKIKITTNKEELMRMDKEELIELVIRMENKTFTLKNTIAKHDGFNDVESKPKRNFDFSKCRKCHVLFRVLYLGWDYQGFASQDDTARTIEYHLFHALIKACLIENIQTANYHKCGRTDKGVSALGQVISLDVRCADEGKEDLPYCRMLNSILPDDIIVLAWAPVSDAYSARFNCTSRTYKYFFPEGNLNIDAMIEAATYLIGTHDYRNLCKMNVANGVVNYIRTINKLQITKVHDDPKKERNGYNMYVMTISADGFLWHQIRCLMGVLFLIGEKKEKPIVIQQLLDIETNPRKPQYLMANEVPLDLHHCEFDSRINWRYDQDNLFEAHKKLQQNWAHHEIKTNHIRNMIEGVEELMDNTNLDQQCSHLVTQQKRKGHKPLLEREKCSTLEERINYYVKKQRLERTNCTEQPIK